MSSQKEDPTLEKTKHIVEKRLLHVPKELKECFPLILSRKDLSYIPYTTQAYFMLAFCDEEDWTRINKLLKEDYQPFPGLIADSPSAKSAFKVDRSKYLMFNKNRVTDTYSFSLGRDSTVILCDHTQSINTKELGRYEYTVQLAYLVSYGDEIDSLNMFDFLDDLIAGSVKIWTDQHEQRSSQ